MVVEQTSITLGLMETSHWIDDYTGRDVPKAQLKLRRPASAR